MAEEKEVKHSITLEPYQVVLHPLVTEKGTHISERHNAYTFAVSPMATKHRDQAGRRRNVERSCRRACGRRIARESRGATASNWATRSAWKKAIVELNPEDRISFF